MIARKLYIFLIILILILPLPITNQSKAGRRIDGVQPPLEGDWIINQSTKISNDNNFIFNRNITVINSSLDILASTVTLTSHSWLKVVSSSLNITNSTIVADTIIGTGNSSIKIVGNSILNLALKLDFSGERIEITGKQDTIVKISVGNMSGGVGGDGGNAELTLSAKGGNIEYAELRSIGGKGGNGASGGGKGGNGGKSVALVNTQKIFATEISSIGGDGGKGGEYGTGINGGSGGNGASSSLAITTGEIKNSIILSKGGSGGSGSRGKNTGKNGTNGGNGGDGGNGGVSNLTLTSISPEGLVIDSSIIKSIGGDGMSGGTGGLVNEGIIAYGGNGGKGGNGGFSTFDIAARDAKGKTEITKSEIIAYGGEGGSGGTFGDASPVEGSQAVKQGEPGNGGGGEGANLSINSYGALAKFSWANISAKGSNGGAGGRGGGKGGDGEKGGTALLKITSKDHIVVSNCSLYGLGGEGGDGGEAEGDFSGGKIPGKIGRGGDASIILNAPTKLEFSSAIVSSKEGLGGGGSEGFAGKGEIDFDTIYFESENSSFNKALKNFNYHDKGKLVSTVVVDILTTLTSITVKDNAIVETYWYLTVVVKDGRKPESKPVGDAKVEVMREEETVTSSQVDETGRVTLLLESYKITKEGSTFLGKYTIIAYNDTETSRRYGKDMLRNEIIELEFIVDNTPPVLSIESPTESIFKTTDTPTVKFEGRASDVESGIKKVSHAKNISGPWQEVNNPKGNWENWDFILNLTLLDPKKIRYTIFVKAVNYKDMITIKEKNITVYFEKEPPPFELKISQPVGGTRAEVGKEVFFNAEILNYSMDYWNITSFIWEFGDGSEPLVYPSFESGKNVRYTYRTTGTYSAKFKVNAVDKINKKATTFETYVEIEIYGKPKEETIFDKILRYIPFIIIGIMCICCIAGIATGRKALMRRREELSKKEEGERIVERAERKCKRCGNVLGGSGICDYCDAKHLLALTKKELGDIKSAGVNVEESIALLEVAHYLFENADYVGTKAKAKEAREKGAELRKKYLEFSDRIEKINEEVMELKKRGIEIENIEALLKNATLAISRSQFDEATGYMNEISSAIVEISSEADKKETEKIVSMIEKMVKNVSERGINVGRGKELAEKAKIALQRNDYVNAKKYANETEKLIEEINKQFLEATESMKICDVLFKDAMKIGVDVSEIERKYENVKIAMGKGDYKDALLNLKEIEPKLKDITTPSKVIRPPRRVDWEAVKEEMPKEEEPRVVLRPGKPQRAIAWDKEIRKVSKTPEEIAKEAIEACESAIAEAMNLGVVVKDANDMLRLAKKNFDAKEYEKAKNYARNAEILVKEIQSVKVKAPAVPPKPRIVIPKPEPMPEPVTAAKVETGKCKKCNKELKPTWKKCPYCGEVVEALAADKCPKCNKDVRPGWKSCPFCGASLK
ncbi:MAG: zinc-ribbon domain-containing protein [Candidatus Thermoplasmatota archaeon]